MSRSGRPLGLLASLLLAPALAFAGPMPVRSRGGMVVSAEATASKVGAEVLHDGGNAVDAAVATAFALAVTYPGAGNIGGGGLLLYRPAEGAPAAYDFRETAPHGASPTMFLRDGHYDAAIHHKSLRSVGVPGTVAGLHLAWREAGKLPWRRLVEPAIRLARDGFVVTDALAASLGKALPDLKGAARAQFSKGGTPYAPGDRLVQEELAGTLE